MVGTFVKMDDDTTNKKRLDVGRALVATSVKEIINKVVNIKINDVIFPFRMMEDAFRSGYYDLKS